MATINYKEKYEKAVHAAMLAKQDTESAVTIRILEEIFPELKESEDVKIEEEIIEYLKLFGKGKEDYFQPTVDRWIAWLEKHDDKVEPKFKVGQTIKKEGFNLGFTIVKIGDGFYYNNIGDHFPFTDQDSWELVEQKPAWSEEDEEILGNALELIEWYYIGSDRDKVDVIKNWLKSFKDRVQPKQEWSEEDATHYNRILKELNLQKEMPINASVIEEVKSDIIWFKSLRPQNRWKPSDEQMTALKHAFNDCSIAFADMEILATLYEQLKALHRYKQDA